MIAVRFGRRAGWGIADQTASSLTNFALGIVVASQVSTASFGAFSLAFVTYLLVLNLGRAVVSLPLMIRYSAVSGGRWALGVSRGVGVALLVGTVAAVVCLPIGVALGGETGASLIGLSVVLPALMAQDAWRFGFFAANRGRDAFVNDAAWAAVLGVGFVVAVTAGVTEPSTYIVLWGLGAAAGSVLGVVQSRLLPQPTAVRSWWAEHADLIPRFSAESIARMGGTQLTYYAIGVIGGLVVVGTLRAAELILGPFNILFQGVHLVALPEAVRLLKESESALVRWARLLSGAMVVAAMAFGAVCLALPDAVGVRLLGDSWMAARTVLPPLILAVAGMVAGAGAGVGLRALAAADRLLRVAVVTSVATFGAATAGVIIGNGIGAAWGMCVGAWIGAAWSWLELRWAVRRGWMLSGADEGGQPAAG